MKADAWTSARVTARQEWTDGLVTLQISLSLDFAAGQFVALGLPDERAKDGRLHRLFSIASAPGEPLEFFIVRVDEGALSPRLDALEVGEELFVHTEPKGVFTLDRVPDARNLWLLATGTGLAPYISMLRTEEPWERYENIVLVQGTRLVRDLAYLEEMEERSAAHGGRLRQVTCVTREDPPEGGYPGRIPGGLEEGQIQALAGCDLTPESSQILLCGNPEMIKQTTAMLEEQGFLQNRAKSPGQITFERYW